MFHCTFYRENVFLEVKQRLSTTGKKNGPADSINEIVDPVLDGLKQNGASYPRTIIYTGLQWCAHIHERAIVKYGFDASTPIEEAFIHQYHASQVPEVIIIIVYILI